jgi:hypothetical protein
MGVNDEYSGKCDNNYEEQENYYENKYNEDDINIYGYIYENEEG